MFRRISMVAAIAVACICTSNVASAQFGGVRVQFGGYGSGLRVAGYGNNYYNSYGNGYRSGYGNPYYGNRYNNVFNGGYYNNARPYTGSYPNFGSSYVSPYLYAPPIRTYPMRRYRYR